MSGSLNCVLLTSDEIDLVRKHRLMARETCQSTELNIKILRVAHDFQVWLSRNPEWTCNQNVFFKQFGYVDDSAGIGKTVFSGVQAVLSALSPSEV